MAGRHAYFDMLDWLDAQYPADPYEFFRRMRSAYGISHLFYADATVFARTVHLHRAHHTLTASQEREVASLDRVVLLSVLRTILGTVRPLEHGTLRKRLPLAAPLFHLIEALGLPVEGISYPLVSTAGRAAALSITIPTSHADLASYLRCYGRDIHTLSALFHAGHVDTEHSAPADDNPISLLTPREHEVLRWSAAGKSYWEIAVILGISERTVRFFMGNARRKLDVVSNTQAVAEAVWRGFLPQA
ncbi:MULTISPECIES: LuxR C-terminal-related transcriptional regulator [unclassified Sinorhizobium]|uniref:helix-turn-helix transcriptional regulator n=1 Tax=unclassified Sinorhizobium TaxID=2613772 RepID=UPI00352419B3